jgi:hypothetical protein
MRKYEELEREAYINGDVELAKLYAELIDAKRNSLDIDGWEWDYE